MKLSQQFFMHMGNQRNIVNEADGCPAREQGR